MLRQQSCRPQCNGARNCPFAEECAYAAIFEPRANSARFSSRPRPFVFRADHLDGQQIEPGQTFSFELNFFDRSPDTLRSVLNAFSALKELGAYRSKTEFLGCETIPRCVDLTPGCEPIRRIQVDFKTPTALKANNTLVSRPDFSVLYARAVERVSAFSGGTLETTSCQDIQLACSSLTDSYVERRSSRTGQRHRLGGFTGSAIYEGQLRACLPVLKAAEFTGVGRHTSWGNGRLIVTALP